MFYGNIEPLQLFVLRIFVAVKWFHLTMKCFVSSAGSNCRRLPAVFTGSLQNSLDNVVISGAPADVPFHLMSDKLFVQHAIVPIDEINGSHDHARGTEAALKAMALAKCFLNGVQLLPVGKAFNGRNFRSGCTCRKN